MLISVDDLRSYMGGWEPPDGLTGEIAAVISGLQAELENYLNRPVEPVQIRETVRSNSKGYLYLSVTPVQRIISYGVSAALAPSIDTIPPPLVRDSSLAEDLRVVDKTMRTNGRSLSAPGGLKGLWPNSLYDVTYIGGYNGYADEALKIGLKRVAAREIATNHIDTAGLRQAVIEQTEVGDQRYLGWAGEELKRLQRARRRIVI